MKRDIVIATISFAMGAVASFFVTQKLLEEKYVVLAQEESSFNERFNQHMERRDVPIKEASTREAPRRDIVSNSSLKGTRTNEYNNIKRNYNLASKQAKSEEVDVKHSDDEYNDESDFDESIDSDNPYVISEDSFSNEFSHHDKLSITYYTDDDVLADENEGIVDDVETLVGYGNLNIFNTGLTHPDIIYIRNERIGTDFEISIISNSYQELVLGIKLDPKQRQMNLSRNRNRERESGH